MSEPIDIKTKKTIPQSSQVKFDKSLVLANLESNILPESELKLAMQEFEVSRKK